jgi:predicted ATPase
VEQPSGTVTLVFTDIEGSTRLLEELGQEAYREALGEHRRVVREAFARFDGYEVDYEGDAFFYAFPSAVGAVEAVREATGGLDGGPIRVRVGIHTGEPGLDPPKYVGRDVHLAARVMSAGHGGQVLLSQSTRGLVEVQAVDLGEHRLKDFDEPVSLFQLGDAAFPPLKTISNTNLPRPASSFVGRGAEVAGVVALVREGARLVTLTGPGGSGKTRLGIEAAAELVPEFRAGVFWVGLATLRDPALVLETIGQILGAKDEPAVHIGEREMLLLLDNLEQVVAAAPELASLVEACPNLVVLVTSRELLRVRGEVEYQVLPLAETDAVELFSARARVEPDASVEELCRRLDNMPLALELAAARATVLSIEQIQERLAQRLDLFKGGRDADPRQQTLRATIEWSYELLTPEERQLFERLSLFAGGCTLEAAEAVADADLDTLQSLVDKSLVRRTGERFWMLETIREYAGERLARTDDERRLRFRVAEHFTRFGEARRARVRQGDLAATGELAAEIDNFRALLQWAETTNEPDVLCSAVASLWFLWISRGQLVEGERWARLAIARAEGLAVEVRIETVLVASELLTSVGARAEAAGLKESIIAVMRDLGGHARLAAALSDLSYLVAEEGDFPRARALAHEALEVRRDESSPCDGTPAGLAHGLSGCAIVEFMSGDFEAARAIHEETIALYLEANELADAAASDMMVGQCARRLGDLDEARRRFASALPVVVEHDQVIVLTELLQEVGALLVVEGKSDEAATLFGWVERRLDEMGAARWDLADYERQMEVLRERLSTERLVCAWNDGAEMTLAEATAFASGILD